MNYGRAYLPNLKLQRGISALQFESTKYACGSYEGRLPGKCAPMAFPYVPMQGENSDRYESAEALCNGTLFPGLNLPFKEAIKGRFPKIRPELAEVMSLDFAVTELGLYLDTHKDDAEALELYWGYVRLAREGREKYQRLYGPIMQTDITPGVYAWLGDPWPWEFAWETEGSAK